jgi:S1-C subfamily serine protease
MTAYLAKILFLALVFSILRINETYSLNILPENNYTGSNRISDIAEKIAPSVVSIQTESEESVEIGIKGTPLDEDFFRKFFGIKPDKSGKFPPQIRKIKSNASGTVLTNDGYILTNYHVIINANKITVITSDGIKYEAKVIGKDKFSDIAVIKINTNNIIPAPFGDSLKSRAGDWAIAVGNPLGLGNTVTFGIISSIDREVPMSNINFIQTDAAINPGNSGGPLANINGEIIGINSAIAGRAQGISFAIPINAAKEIAEQLITGKIIPRPWIGITISSVDESELAKSINISTDTKGIIVNNVFPDSPALLAGLTQGDVIQKVQGKVVIQPKEFQYIIRSLPINSTANIEFLRNEKIYRTKIKIVQWPEKDDYE